MSGNGLVYSPIEINLDGCGIDVLEAKTESGQIHRQLRITHASGLLPVTLVLTLPERSAMNVGRKLCGSKLLVALDDDAA